MIFSQFIVHTWFNFCKSSTSHLSSNWSFHPRFHIKRMVDISNNLSDSVTCSSFSDVVDCSCWCLLYFYTFCAWHFPWYKFSDFKMQKINFHNGKTQIWKTFLLNLKIIFTSRHQQVFHPKLFHDRKHFRWKFMII